MLNFNLPSSVVGLVAKETSDESKSRKRINQIYPLVVSIVK